MLILVFDTETTGLPKAKFLSKNTLHLWTYIVQFSYILYDSDNHNLVKIRDWIVKLPDNIIIEEEAVKIHGITNEIMQSKGHNINTVFTEFFQDFAIADKIVAHNLNFDINMIKAELLRSDNSLQNQYYDYLNSSNKLYCTMQETIDFCNIIKLDKKGLEYQKYPKLIELYQKLFNEIPHNLHNSLNDVIVCLRCFMKWKYNVDILDKNKEIESFISTRLL